MRLLYFTLGWVFFAAGFAGVFLPVVPTTPFMLLALWCFARSSPRFHDWLYHHKLFGPPLQQWEKYRVIPPIAKFFAVLFMTISLTYMIFFSSAPLWASALAAAIIAFACWFILTKPSRAPDTV